jgi:hypothetical protein
MRIVLAALVVLATSACTERYHSAHPPDSGPAYLLFAPLPTAKAVTTEALARSFTGEPVREITDGHRTGFSWSHMPFLDRTNYELFFDPYSGTGPDGSTMNGYAIEVTTRGTQAAVVSRWVMPLIREIGDVCAERQVTFVAVTSPQPRIEMASPSVTTAAAAIEPAAPATPAQRLSTLDQLHAQGLITDDEYTAKRKAIIDGL